MIKNVILLLLILSNVILLNAQSNRVLNPNLEEHDTCFPALGGFRDGQVKYWSDPNMGSSDYFLKYALDISTAGVCSYRNYCTPPLTLFGFEFPHSGGSYGGAVEYLDGDSTFREYVQASFISRLDSNKMYPFECFISVADNSNCTPNFGLYFSDTAVYQLGGRIQAIPQFSNPISSPINTQHGWQRITGSYLSDGKDSFLVMGNFTPYYLRTISPCASGIDRVQASYFFIDDVAVYDTSLIDTVTLCLHDSIQFNNLWYKTDGLYIDMIGGLPVKRLIQHRPESASYTFVDVPFVVGDTVEIGFMAVCHSDSFVYPYLFCDSTDGIACYHEIYLWPIVRDTVIDQVFENIYGCDSTVRYRVRTNDTVSNIGIDAISLGMFALTIYPNPTNEFLSIKLNTNKNTIYSIEILDISGRAVLTQSLVDANIDISLLTSGMYFVKLFNSKTGKLLGTEKFVKE